MPIIPSLARCATQVVKMSNVYVIWAMIRICFHLSTSILSVRLGPQPMGAFVLPQLTNRRPRNCQIEGQVSLKRSQFLHSVPFPRNCFSIFWQRTELLMKLGRKTLECRPIPCEAMILWSEKSIKKPIRVYRWSSS